MAEDLISRRTAIDAAHKNYDTILDFKSDGRTVAYSFEDIINALPSAQPERLTDDDFETIRIHLNAYKEKLCNQHRWEEANEYQRIIDRFMAFASSQPDIIRCKDCKYWTHIKRTNRYWCKTDDGLFDLNPSPDDFCSRAERRTDEVQRL